MTLSFSKFRVIPYLNIRCTVCGTCSDGEDTRFDDLVEWAEQHECPGLRVT